MHRFALFVVRRRWWVLAGWLAFIVAVQGLLAGIGGSQYKDDFKLPNTQTATVSHLLTSSGLASANGASGNMVLHARTGTVADFAGTVQPALQRLCSADLGIASISSPYGAISCTGSTGAGPDVRSLVSADRRIGLVNLNWTARQPPPG